MCLFPYHKALISFFFFYSLTGLWVAAEARSWNKNDAVFGASRVWFPQTVTQAVAWMRMRHATCTQPSVSGVENRLSPADDRPRRFSSKCLYLSLCQLTAFQGRDDSSAKPVLAGISRAGRYLWGCAGARLQAGSDVNLTGRVNFQPAHQWDARSDIWAGKLGKVYGLWVIRPQK